MTRRGYTSTIMNKFIILFVLTVGTGICQEMQINIKVFTRDQLDGLKTGKYKPRDIPYDTWVKAGIDPALIGVKEHETPEDLLCKDPYACLDVCNDHGMMGGECVLYGCKCIKPEGYVPVTGPMISPSEMQRQMIAGMIEMLEAQQAAG